MTTTIEPTDLDVLPAPAPAPRRLTAVLPWALFGVTATALVATLIGRPPAAIADPAPVTTAAAQATSEPKIDEQTSSGTSAGLTVWRDVNGVMIGVMDVVRPSAYEDVWCRLTVDGKVVESTGSNGWPATCVWIRGMA